MGDPLVAYECAAPLGALEAEQLLGLLAHTPSARESGIRLDTIRGGYRRRLAQAWVCIGILHHRLDQPWPGSERRSLLLRLLHGPEDWTVDSAAFALSISAWLHPDQRSDIAEALTERYRFAARAVGRRPTELHDPLARVLLLCPGLDPALRSEVEARRHAAHASTERERPAFIRGLRRRLKGTGVHVLDPGE